LSDDGVGGPSLRVFDFAASSGDESELRSVRVDLPVAWARRHSDVVVAFMDGSSDLGWHAHLVGDDGDVLLSFPWLDHVDRVLLGQEDGDLPTVARQNAWDDLEQGWWGWVKAEGDDAFIAETDLDALTDVGSSPVLERRAPGVVLVHGVEVRWSRVDRLSYDRAWRDAITACRRGPPSPVCEWVSPEGLGTYRRVRLSP
jgi:hypothetical protein